VAAHKDLSGAQGCIFAHTHYVQRVRTHGVRRSSNQRGFDLQLGVEQEVNSRASLRSTNNWRQRDEFDMKQCLEVATSLSTAKNKFIPAQYMRRTGRRCLRTGLTSCSDIISPIPSRPHIQSGVDYEGKANASTWSKCLWLLIKMKQERTRPGSKPQDKFIHRYG
jgi:hypothetical protein